MGLDNLQRGIGWDAAEEGEVNSVKRWEEILVKWHPFNRQLARIFSEMDRENRLGASEEFSKMEGGEDENYMQFITDLSSLSDLAFERIIQAITNTQQESDRRWKQERQEPK